MSQLSSLFVIPALLTSACAPLAALNVVAPGAGPSEAGAAYGPLPRQRLDTYRPGGGAAEAPVVVFFYGGRWQSGDRDAYRFAARALAGRGFAVAVPDYRLYPEVQFPAFVEDAAQAVKWVQRNAETFGGDPARIFLMGHSAGAHIAALLHFDERYLEAAGVPRGAIAGSIGLAGAYDFLPFSDADLEAVFGPRDRWPESQPIRFVDGTEPPFLLLHGEADGVSRPGNSTRLAARIRERGGQVTLKTYPGVGHYRILAALAGPLNWLTPVVGDTIGFLRREPPGGR